MISLARFHLTKSTMLNDASVPHSLLAPQTHNSTANNSINIPHCFEDGGMRAYDLLLRYDSTRTASRCRHPQCCPTFKPTEVQLLILQLGPPPLQLISTLLLVMLRLQSIADIGISCAGFLHSTLPSTAPSVNLRLQPSTLVSR